MRNRPAALIKDQIRRNREKRIDYYFFTDDNFSRNPNWEEIFDAIIELKREQGITIQFMMQIDVPAYRISRFVDKAAEELYPKWRDNFEQWEKTGSDFGYHYMGSAIWFNRIGRAMGEAMLDLMAEDN